MIPLSLVIITKNEEANIERCIRSVPFAQDIVVLDSRSEDRTVEIAKRLGARTMVEPFRGYYKQKVRATALAFHPWVLNLDADEALSEASQKELQKLLQNEPTHAAYSLPRLSYHLGRWIHHGGWYPDRQVRLFNKDQAQWQEGKVHEKVQAHSLGQLKSPIHHWVFHDLADQVDTNNEYSSLGAEQLYERGKRFSLLMMIVKTKSKFFETYIFKRGFMDGLPGFVIAVGAAYSVFLKWAKLWELHKIKSKRPSSG